MADKSSQISFFLRYEMSLFSAFGTVGTKQLTPAERLMHYTRRATLKRDSATDQIQIGLEGLGFEENIENIEK